MQFDEAGGNESEVRGVLRPVGSTAEAPTREKRAAPTRRRVLLSVTRRGRGLSRALLEHLAAELPELAFTLDERAPVDAIWLCGFDGNGPDQLRRLRADHPRAVVLVTRRGRADGWERVALARGADHAVAWPVPYGRLSRILSGAEPAAPRSACS